MGFACLNWGFWGGSFVLCLFDWLRIRVVQVSEKRIQKGRRVSGTEELWNSGVWREFRELEQVPLILSPYSAWK